jgi:hypothetical protein
MAAIFAQMHSDAIGTRSLARKREGDAVGLDLVAVIERVLTVTRLPNSRDVIDVDAE